MAMHWKFLGAGRTICVECKATPELMRLAQNALSIQDASNLCGLAQSFAVVQRTLLHNSENQLGTVWANQHPITLAWVDKFAHLSGYRQDLNTNHLTLCELLAKGQMIEFEVKIDSRERETYDEIIQKAGSK